MNDAELILAQLNLEMAVLKKELDKCLLDLDYEYAHFFQTSMHFKRTEINAIERRVQQNFDEIRYCKMKISTSQRVKKRMEEQLNSNLENKKIKERILFNIEESKQKLNEHLDELLELKRTNTSIQVDSDILIEEIEDFLSKESKMFCLEVNDVGVLNYISVKKQESDLIIQYVNGNLRVGNRRVSKYFKKALCRIGFIEDENSAWTLLIDKSEVDANNIMITISSIIFEVIQPTKKSKCNLLVRDY
jgi:hypothetical protein